MIKTDGADKGENKKGIVQIGIMEITPERRISIINIGKVQIMT